jgi:LacI family transcriptional regulator
MMQRTKPVSQGDIAKQTGFSRMAVSYALNNDPRLSEETRQIIQAAAKKLGYSPDARFSMWMKKVRDTKQAEPVTVAWLNTDSAPDTWRKCKWLSPYLEGTQKRCAELGYNLEEFWLLEPGMSARRMSNILINRGIKGVIIAPSREISVGHIKLEWDHFACISFEKAILAPRLHRVAPDYSYNMLLTLKLLRRFGYRRIGVLLQQHSERRSNHNYLAALHLFHSNLPKEERLPALLFQNADDTPILGRNFKTWLDKKKPDVIVGHHHQVINWLGQVGLSVPKDIGVVHLAIEDDVADWAGIWQRKREIGAETAEVVISMLQNNRFGLPAVPRDILIRGYWHHGWTLNLHGRTAPQPAPIPALESPAHMRSQAPANKIS